MEIEKKTYYIVFDTFLQNKEMVYIKGVFENSQDAEFLIDKLHREEIELEILRCKMNIMNCMDSSERVEINYNKSMLEQQLKFRSNINYYSLGDKVIQRYKYYSFSS